MLFLCSLSCDKIKASNPNSEFFICASGKNINNLTLGVYIAWVWWVITPEKKDDDSVKPIIEYLLLET